MHAHEEFATWAKRRCEVRRAVRVHQKLAVVSIGKPISVLYHALVSGHVRKHNSKAEVEYVPACDKAYVDLRSPAMGIFKADQWLMNLARYVRHETLKQDQ
jgi:hypothetical protein